MITVAAAGCTEERDDPNSGEYLVDGHAVGYRTDLDDQGVGSMCLTLDGSEEICFVLDISLDEDLERGGLVSTSTAWLVGTSGTNRAALVQMVVLPPGGDTVWVQLSPTGLDRSVRVRTPTGAIPPRSRHFEFDWDQPDQFS